MVVTALGDMLNFWWYLNIIFLSGHTNYIPALILYIIFNIYIIIIIII